MINCVLLSAGFSSRFGSPKALAPLNGQNVIQHLQDKLLSIAELFETTIVLGASADLIKPFLLKHKKLKVVYNKDYKLGQTSSFKAGLQEQSPECEAVFLLPVDYPFIKKSTLEAIISRFMKECPSAIVPVYQNRKGHPPLLSRDMFKEILSLKNKDGLNTVIHNHGSEILYLEVNDPGVIETFNTPEEFGDIKRLAG